MARRRRHNNALRWIETGPRAAEPLTGGSAAPAPPLSGPRRVSACGRRRDKCPCYNHEHVSILETPWQARGRALLVLPGTITGARAARAPLHLEGAAGDRNRHQARGCWGAGSRVGALPALVPRRPAGSVRAGRRVRVQFGSHAFPLRALTRAVRVQLQAPLRQPPGLVELRQLVAQAATWSPPRSDCHLVSSEAVGAELP